jgi:hypothetical protein
LSAAAMAAKAYSNNLEAQNGAGVS